MEVILREHVDNLGRRGEIVKVADGYARNYLLPRKLALLATEGNKKQIERERVKFEAKELEERGDAIDLVTLKEELGRSGDIDEVGGPAYIAALVDGVPRSTNVEHYAKIIKDKSTLRSLIYSANKILGAAYDAEEDVDVILDQAEHAIF